MHIHHIGYLVRSLEKARAVFEKLGYISEKSEPCLDESRGVRICFMKNSDYRLELIEPYGKNSSISGLIKRYRNSPYHICHVSSTLEQDISILQQDGFKVLGPAAYAPALGNRRVVFLVHPLMGMIELLEAE